VIAQINDYLVVRDLDSTNGIRINGAKVTEGRLNPGDELILGNHAFRVQNEAHPLANAPRPAAAAPVASRHEGDSLDDDDLEEADEPIPLFDKAQALPPRPPRPPRRTEVRDDSDPIA
jgi:predicted component of type VI protein secretion system